MKDKLARALAIVALVFMAVFVVMLAAVFAIPKGIAHDAIMYTAIGSGAVGLVLFAVLKLDGRGYSMRKINNEIEMQKIEAENAELIESARREADEASAAPGAQSPEQTSGVDGDGQA